MITHYLALRDSLAQRILGKEIVGGTKLPSERLLQAEFGVARGTVREALFQLEAEGLIYRRDRSGWYVSQAAVFYDPTRWAGFMTYVAEQGRDPTTETLSKTTEAAPDAVSVFGHAPDQPLHVIRRRRAIDGHPVLVERIIVHPDLAPGLLAHDLDQSLTQVLKTIYGVSVARNLVTMRPCALIKDEAAALGVKSGTPGLLVERTSLTADGRVVEYDHEYWRHDAIVIRVDIGVA
jgi:DNA-binding GntR family transcriptional regulator